MSRRLRLVLLVVGLAVGLQVPLVAAVVPIALAIAYFAAVSIDAALAVGVALSAAGGALSLRQRPRIRTHEVAITGLPAAFDGYRIAQISDLHCGPFASAHRVAGWVAA